MHRCNLVLLHTVYPGKFGGDLKLVVGLGCIPTCIFSNLTEFFLLLNGIYHCFSNTEL